MNQDTQDDYLILLKWGILSVRPVECNGKLHFRITVPKEVEEKVLPVYHRLNDVGIAGKQIADYLDLEHIYTLDELQQHYIEMFLQIKQILTIYGGMEQDTLYQMFRKLLLGGL